MKIRAARTSDLPHLVALYGELNPGDDTISVVDAAAKMEQLTSITGSNIYVGELDGVVVTSCTLVVVPNLTRSGRPYSLIENVVTGAMYRNRGCGTRLLEHAIREAWEHNCYKVMLLTGSRTPATLRFYKKVGFEQSKTGFQIRASEEKLVLTEDYDAGVT